MQAATGKQTTLRIVVLGALACALSGGGCGLFGQKLQTPPPSPPSGSPRFTSLESVKTRLVQNDMAFRTLKADCRAVMTTPQAQTLRPFEMSGTFVLKKPPALEGEGTQGAQVYLRLSGPGKVYAQLLGDGQQYVVRLPLFQDMSYSGDYADPLEPRPGRVHFMPQDVAAAFNLGWLVVGKSLTLKGFPDRWETMPIRGRPQHVEKAVWLMDAIQVSEQREPKVAVLNTLALNPATESVERIDRFRWDGSLKVRIWILSSTLVRRPEDGVSVRVPEEIMLWYPPPLENTMIRLRFQNHKVQIAVPDETFELRGSSPLRAPSVRHIPGT